jgi:GT2 family glycosyltransferase
MPLSLSISIVLFHPKEEVLSRVLSHLKIAILHARMHIPLKVQLFLIDNSISPLSYSIQNLATQFFEKETQVVWEYIYNAENTGYGAGNNLAIARTQSQYHLIMNPDVFVEKDTLLYASQYMEMHPEVALLAPDVYSESGERQFLCKKNPTLFDMCLRNFAPAFVQDIWRTRMQQFEMRDKNYEEEMYDVPFMTGCFMYMRTEVLKKLQGFDEDFFLYFEDADLSRRVLQISHSAYVPKVKIVHQWARDSRKKFSMLWLSVKSGMLYWKKHGGMY